MEGSGTGHWPTKSPICQSGCNPGGREGSWGLTLMLLWSWSAGPAVPDTLLSHSLIKTHNCKQPKKHGADRLAQTRRPLAPIIYPPCDWSPGNCRFLEEKNSKWKQKRVPLWQPVSVQLSYRDVLRLTDRQMCKRAGATVTDQNKPNI